MSKERMDKDGAVMTLWCRNDVEHKRWCAASGVRRLASGFLAFV